MVVDAIFLKRRITQIGPQHGHQTQLVRAFKRSGDFFDLPTRLLGTEIDRRPDRHGAHIECLLNAGVQRLIVFGRVAQRLVMVQFDQEGDAVRIAARHRGQHAIGGGHAVTTGLNGQFDDIFRIKVQRVGGKRGASRMLYALVDRQDRQISGSRQAAGVIQGLHITQHRRRTIVIHHHPIDIIRPR